MTKTLADLNALRIDLGMSPLKSWKESKAKLSDQIEKLQARYDELMAAAPALKIVPTVDGGKAVVKNDRKATVKRLAAEAIAEKERLARLEASAKNKPLKIKSAKVNVASIAKELGLNPKVARAKVRKAGAKTEKEIRALLKK